MLNKPKFRNIKKILVIGTNWLGDSVITIPTLYGIRSIFPDAHIAIHARHSVADIFQTVPVVDEIISYKKKEGLEKIPGLIDRALTIKKMFFNLALIFPRSFESALICFLARVPYRVGFDCGLRNIFLTEVLKRGKEICSVHQVHYYKKLLEPFGKAEFPEFPSLILHEAEREWANKFIKAKINKSYSFIIGLNPGSTFGIAKQWLPERFEELARRLISSHNCKIVLFGDSSTSDLAIKINSGLNSMAIDATGKTTVLQLAALIERCDIMITNDSGPMHIACAVGTPVVAVFGSTHPAATSPLGPDSMVIWKEMPCCPCHKRTCPEVHHKCMVEVSVDEVEEAVLKQLKNRTNLKFILDTIN